MAAVTSRDIAIAAEAINRHRGLTPSARQVALEILQGMDKRTATTWRSVGGIAARLGLAARTIGYALQLLRELGLIDTRARGGKGLLFRLSWSSLKRIGAAIKREVGKRLGTRTRVQGLDLPPERPRDRQPAAPVLPLVRFNRGAEGKRASTPAAKSTVPDEILNRKAHGRLWECIRGAGAELVAALMGHPMAGEIEEEAVRAERYQPGSGVIVLLNRLRARAC